MISTFTKYFRGKVLHKSVQNTLRTKRHKPLSLGISEHDGKILTKVKKRAHHLDMGLFNICGIRFGWSNVVGIIPGYKAISNNGNAELRLQ